MIFISLQRLRLENLVALTEQTEKRDELLRQQAEQERSPNIHNNNKQSVSEKRRKTTDIFRASSGENIAEKNRGSKNGTVRRRNFGRDNKLCTNLSMSIMLSSFFLQIGRKLQ